MGAWGEAQAAGINRKTAWWKSEVLMRGLLSVAEATTGTALIICTARVCARLHPFVSIMACSRALTCAPSLCRTCP